MAKSTEIFSTILVTGCGGDIGMSIGKILKMEKISHRVIGCDLNNEHAGIFIFDKCEVVERADSPKYLESMHKIIKKYDVKVIIPMSEAEIRFFSAKEMNEIYEIPLIITNKDALRVGFDKLETANFLKAANLPFPWTHLAGLGAPKEMPCIIKSRFSSGSKELGIVTRENLEQYSKFGKDCIFQEYLKPDDEEYTCGLYRTKDKEIRTIVFKRKLQGGHTGYGEVVEIREIENVLNRIAREINLEGSINIQLRLTERGPVVFEINPRFSSTVLFRHLLGFEDVIWMLQEKSGEKVGSYIKQKKGAKIYKGFQEYILLKDNTIPIGGAGWKSK